MGTKQDTTERHRAYVTKLINAMRNCVLVVRQSVSPGTPCRFEIQLMRAYKSLAVPLCARTYRLQALR